MASCAIIIASVCFLNAQSAVFKDAGLSAEARIRLHETEVVVELRSDHIQTLDWKRLPVTCNRNFCVAYFKHCASTQKSATCNYHYMVLGDEQENVVTLTTKAIDQIKRSETSVAAISRMGELGGEISFSTFASESTSEYPPYCRAGGPKADCGHVDIRER